MKNPVGRLKTAWYNRLNGNLTYNSVQVPVFREDADTIPPSHYVLIRSGGARNQRTDDSFMKEVFLFIQIVTKFSASTGINDTIVDDIDEQIQELITPTTLDDTLSDGTFFQVINVNPEDEVYETIADETTKYHIKTTRWEHLAVQKN